MTTRSQRLSRVSLPFGLMLAAFCVGCGDDTPMLSPDAGPACVQHTDCDDGVFCNGAEQCSSTSPDADARGCVAGASACPASVTCDEASASCGSACSVPDMDGDGHNSVACGGDDCDDTDPDRFPGNVETCNDGLDLSQRLRTPQSR